MKIVEIECDKHVKTAVVGDDDMKMRNLVKALRKVTLLMYVYLYAL
jgi:hypothetical protein